MVPSKNIFENPYVLVYVFPLAREKLFLIGFFISGISFERKRADVIIPALIVMLLLICNRSYNICLSDKFQTILLDDLLNLPMNQTHARFPDIQSQALAILVLRKGFFPSVWTNRLHT